jgi:hypothetical protein
LAGHDLVLCSFALFGIVESVTTTADGSFIMLDRYGAVREAWQQGGAMVLNPVPIAHLGPGRPLGAQYDAAGSLIICDAFKVRCALSVCVSLLFWLSQLG